MNGRGKILIVDDDPSIRGLLAAWLEEAGYKIILAGDGQQALEQTRREDPDLVLLDLSMPKLDGYGVIRALRQGLDTYDLPVIVISADIRAPQKLMGLRVQGFLSKPFDLDEVLVRTRELLSPDQALSAVV